MPQVISASCVEDIAQTDGRHWVTETFALDDGTSRQSSYLAPVGSDLPAHLAAMEVSMNADLADGEA